MWARQARIVLALTVLLDVAIASPWCDQLQNQYSPGKRYLSLDGELKNISLYWGSDPAHAASALFKVIIERAHGYQNVRLIKAAHDLKRLHAIVPFDKYGHYDEAILVLSTGWDPTIKLTETEGYSYGLGGSRLNEFGTSNVPARLRLHVHLATDVESKKQCHNSVQWNFYTNVNVMEDCGFIDTSVRTKYAVVYIILDSNNENIARVKAALQTRVKGFNLFLNSMELNRTSFLKKVDSGDQSFLFIDYDMWVRNKSNIYIVQEPPCSSKDTACSPQLDNSIGLRLIDMYTLISHASQIFQLAVNFNPPLESLKFILEKKAKEIEIEKAACEWAVNNTIAVNSSWVMKYALKNKEYEILIFYTDAARKNKTCPDEESKYVKLITNVTTELNELYQSDYNLTLRYYCPMDNFNASYVKSELNFFSTYIGKEKVIGAVVGGDDDLTDIGKSFNDMGIPVFFYDVSTKGSNSMSSVWLTTGDSDQLVLAMKHFIQYNDWKRVAILSDQTHVAKQFLEGLRKASNLIIGNHPMQNPLTNKDAKEVLTQLKSENAHVIVVNMHNQNAATLLKAAIELEMNMETDYAWIIRNWEPYNNQPINLKFFTLSFSCRGCEYMTSSRHDNISQKLQTTMNDLWPGYQWPRTAVALLDAWLTMAKGFNYAVHEYPHSLEDLHSTKAIQQFEKSLIDLSPIKAFSQDLVFEKHSLGKTVIYLEELYNGNATVLAQWRVNTTANTVEIVKEYRNVYHHVTKPDDGASKCLLSVGDAYLPTCLDIYWIIGLVLLLLALPAGWLVKGAVHRHLRKLHRKMLNDLLAKRMERAAMLSNYLVDRSDLKPREEIGAGRFGRVRVADLLVPGCKSRIVAAKELRDQQEESEILREACILAYLKHDNIIRLVGVCIDKEPTVLLMEVAFFGDLLQYLKDRRYIAEGVTLDAESEGDQISEEAVHVTPKALTRLAREAASALAYLALCGIIHRDLRASNCLIDERRSLKLADFGLARETKAKGLDGVGEYACRRRGIFPVLWMAPESLKCGVFSTASDVYSFGMLIFELVTLGARPYGNISPMVVMQYVTTGGMPQMPADATPQSNSLAQLCWQRQAEKRPSAAEIVVYLAEHPTALSPALHYDNKLYTDADSGYGESPYTQMLLQ